MRSGALQTISEYRARLTGTERRIADFILNAPQKVLHLNITELARQCNTSAAAVVRFCRHIGASGYSDFKLWLAKDVYQGWNEKFLPDLGLDSSTTAVRAITDMTEAVKRTMNALAASLSPESVEKAAERILSSPMTMLFGVGASGLVAADLHQKLSRIGLPSSYLYDTHAQISAACSLRKDDTAFIISYSGETDAMIEAADQALQQGAFLIAMTMSGMSRLRARADLTLDIPAVERVYRSAAELSRIGQLAAVDILYNVIISHDIDRAIEAVERSMQATHRF